MDVKTIYVVQGLDQVDWECEFVFDSNFQLLGGWSNNDANWRNEYFSGFMEELGFKVKTKLPKNAPQNLIKEASQSLFGI